MANKNVLKLIFTAAMAGSLLMGMSTSLKADERDEACRKRIHKAEENLRRAERRHGEHSRQAEERRHQLEEVREHCHHDRR